MTPPAGPWSWQTPGVVAGVEQELGVASIRPRGVRVEDHVALRRCLDVVLEAERVGRVTQALGGGMPRDEAGREAVDLTVLRQPDDRLPGAVQAGGERADRGVDLALLLEVVEIGVRDR